MSLFDRLVDQALKNQVELAPLRTVVEKELLHHDIIREMSAANLLGELTFAGSTCLRACYGSSRLSEDLNFTGGHGFKRDTLNGMGETLAGRLQDKYGMAVQVRGSTKESGNVITWKTRVVVRPDQKDMPVQRINIDIRAIPSYDRRPMVLRNHYGVDMGTSGLIIQAQSREEILAEKIVAFALRPNRLKNRDLWDIGWLKQQNIVLPLDLIPRKIADHRRSLDEFLKLLVQRRSQLQDDPRLRLDFVREMQRFLPPRVVAETVEQEPFWDYLTGLVFAECEGTIHTLKGGSESSRFIMT